MAKGPSGDSGAHVHESGDELASRAMNGINFVTDAKGRKVAVQFDLKKHRGLWEDIEDVLVSRSQCNR
jgi:hypothetical protein